jgi:cbb3-type cytochrome oxidase subunit 3
MEGIDDVAIYPMISLIIFFVFFAVLFWWVLKAKKDYIQKVSNLPLDNDNTDQL